MSDRTPVTAAGLTKFDTMEPEEAALHAWKDGGANPKWHRKKQLQLHREMPVLARALDRMVYGNAIACKPMARALSPLAEKILELHCISYDNVSDETYQLNQKCGECGFSYPCDTAMLVL